MEILKGFKDCINEHTLKKNIILILIFKHQSLVATTTIATPLNEC
jgi:hypothetical protein